MLSLTAILLVHRTVPGTGKAPGKRLLDTLCGLTGRLRTLGMGLSSHLGAREAQGCPWAVGRGGGDGAAFTLPTQGGSGPSPALAPITAAGRGILSKVWSSCGALALSGTPSVTTHRPQQALTREGSRLCLLMPEHVFKPSRGFWARGVGRDPRGEART